MKNLKLNLCLLSIFLFISACKKDKDDPSSEMEEKDPITLTLTAEPDFENNRVQLSWDFSGSDDFVEYTLFRTPVIDPSPVNNDGTYQFTFKNINTTTFTDKFLHGVDDYKYYLRASIEGCPTIQSNFEIVESPDTGIPINFRHGAYWKGTGFLFLTGESGKLLKYDLEDRTVVAEIQLDMIDPMIRIGDAGEGNELYVFSDEVDDRLLVINPDDLSIKEEQSWGDDFGIWDVGMSENGFLLIATNKVGNTLFSVQRADWSYVDEYVTQSALDKRRLKILDQDEGQFVDASVNKLVIYQLDDNGMLSILDQMDIFDFSVASNPLYWLITDIAVSPEGQFIPYAGPLVYDDNLERIFDVNGFSRAYAFNSAGNQLYRELGADIVREDYPSFNNYRRLFSGNYNDEIEQLFEYSDQLLAVQKVYEEEQGIYYTYVYQVSFD